MSDHEEESGGDTIKDLLASNEAFSEIVSEASSQGNALAPSDLQPGFTAMVTLMTEGIKAAVTEALRASGENTAATAANNAGAGRARRVSVLTAHNNVPHWR